MLPPPPVTGAAVGTGVAVGMAVTVAVTGAVTVAVTGAVTVTVGKAVGEYVPVAVGVTVTVTVGDGLRPWAPDSVVACVGVPVSAITAAPIARQPEARMMRIAISRSRLPDRSMTIVSVTDRSPVANASASPQVTKPFTPANRIYRPEMREVE
jgi:hypothetical protein